MTKTILTVYQKQVILVGVILLSRDKTDSESNSIASLEELSFLASTAGAIVVGQIIQARNKPDSSYYIGKGKAEEIAELVKDKKATGIIFNADLSPAHIRNLESVLNVSVIDRTELILTIFNTHARTTQAKLQVELAQLEYTLPRLKHLWGHLSRLGGSGGVKIGMRGPGEKQLEVDRRLIFQKITGLKKDIKEIQNRRKLEVSGRSEEFTVALVGYTNAGKSTLMNSLTDLNVLTEDKLFSTLDTKTYLWKLKSGQKIFLSDTVGFIKDLPHHLISSFHATLEEVRQADLLLHVVDASSKQAEQQINAVNAVLNQLECSNKEIIIVLNKIDRADTIELEILKKRFPEAYSLSALKNIGLDKLDEKIEEIINRRQLKLSIKIPVENGRLMAYLHERGTILQKTLIKNSYFNIKVRLGQRDLLKAKELGLSLRTQPLRRRTGSSNKGVIDE
ncbi:MAG: GTPase HflX [Planctomycetota bacterium]